MAFFPFKRLTFKCRVPMVNFKGAAPLVNLPFPKIPFEYFGPLLWNLLGFCVFWGFSWLPSER